MDIIYTLVQLLLIFLVVVGFVLVSALIYNIVSRLVKTEQFMNNYLEPGNKNGCVKQCVDRCNIGSTGRNSEDTSYPIGAGQHLRFNSVDQNQYSQPQVQPQSQSAPQPQSPPQPQPPQPLPPQQNVIQSRPTSRDQSDQDYDEQDYDEQSNYGNYQPNNNNDISGMKEELTYNKRLNQTYYDKFEELKNNDRFYDKSYNDPSCREFRTSQANQGNISGIPYARPCW